jgi:hypothetical protein
MTTPSFRRGSAAAERASKPKGRFARVKNFSLEDKEEITLRFLTDEPEWITVDQHTSVPTKNQPEGYKGKWPKAMPGVCRYDEAFRGLYEDCYVCDKPVMNPWNKEKPLGRTPRTWALAVVREEVRRGVYKDSIIKNTREIDGKTVETEDLHVLVVNMAQKNFFSALAGIANMNGTVCDTDFRIRRQGGGTDTTYVIMPLMAKGENINPQDDPEEWKERYLDKLEAQNINLAEIVAEKASDEYYRKFFDDRFDTPVQSSGTIEDTDTSPEPSSVPEPPMDALEAMKARVRGY